MLDKIKLLLGIAEADESKDELLHLLIQLCKDEAIDFCNLDEYISKLDSAVISMVIERYNKIGNEGAVSVNTNGITENYLENYSTPIINKLIKNRKIRIIKAS